MSTLREAHGWHSGDKACIGAGCPIVDQDGDHETPDPHSPDWYDGYVAGHRAGGRHASLDVERLARAIHYGTLQSGRHAGDPLCSRRGMRYELCPASPHRLHAEAIAAEYAKAES